MNTETISAIREYLACSRDSIDVALADRAFLETSAAVVDCMVATLRNGNKILLIGNGGSAGDAQHIAGEFVCRLNYDRAPLAAIALTTDSSVLTAIGNDYGYDHVFERQVLALGSLGDLLIAITTSGRSPNILRAAKAARQKGLTVVGFTGASAGDLSALCDICVCAPSTSTPLIQQLHITAAHIICGLVEERLFPRGAAGHPPSAATE